MSCKGKQDTELLLASAPARNNLKNLTNNTSNYLLKKYSERTGFEYLKTHLQ